MLHFSNTLIILSFLLLLIFLVALPEGSISVILREAAEHPYVEKCTVPVSPSEVVSCNV